MSLGLNCQYIEVKQKKNGTTESINLLGERGLQFGRYKAGKYSKSDIHDVWLNNNEIIDIEMEFKMKNLAIEKAVRDFNITL